MSIKDKKNAAHTYRFADFKKAKAFALTVGGRFGPKKVSQRPKAKAYEVEVQGSESELLAIVDLESVVKLMLPTSVHSLSSIVSKIRSELLKIDREKVSCSKVVLIETDGS